MAETRITDRERYTKIAEAIPEYKDWAEKKIKYIDDRNERRRNAEKKPTKAQTEALALKPVVLGLITDKFQSSKAIADQLEGKPAFQKITPILKALVEEGAIVKVKEKGNFGYILATPTEE